MSKKQPVFSEKLKPQGYKQVKVYVPWGVASDFKRACTAQNTSMSHMVTALMEDLLGRSKPAQRPPLDYSTRRKRRKAVSSIVGQLAEIRTFEESYRDNIPENLQNSSIYDLAEEYIACLDEAAELLTQLC